MADRETVQRRRREHGRRFRGRVEALEREVTWLRADEAYWNRRHPGEKIFIDTSNVDGFLERMRARLIEEGMWGDAIARTEGGHRAAE